MDSPVFLAILAVLWVLVIYLLLDKGEESLFSMLIRIGVSVILIYGFTIVPGLVKLIPAVILSMMWGPQVAQLAAGAFMESLTGAGQRPDDQAYYSVAEGKRARGDLPGAIAAINTELQKFPGDFDGQMLLASIQAESQLNFDAARITIDNLLHQPQHTPAKISNALTTLADWQLKYARDTEGARATLERLMGLFPGTLIELRAAQRVARMDQSFEFDDHRDAGLLVSDCLKHLGCHPLDNHTREVLARIYFKRYGRPDLAIEELNKLGATPHQTADDVSRWLHLAADWHLESGNHAGAMECMASLMARYPGRAVAERAEQRLGMLRAGAA